MTSVILAPPVRTEASSTRVLIVDDEPYNLDVLEQELELLGHASVRAGNGEEALERLRASSFDLALLDVMMPRIDGFALLRPKDRVSRY